MALPVHIHNQINDSLASLEALENKRIEKFTHAHVCIPQVGKREKKKKKILQRSSLALNCSNLSRDKKEEAEHG